MASIVHDILAPHLHRTADDDRPIVVMTCGVAGSGKTTLAKYLTTLYPSFHRISGDEIIARQHGIYGIDYAPSRTIYAQYQDEQDIIYMSTFTTLLSERKDVILERSFYAKEDRDEFRKMAEDAGARVVLVFLRAKGEEGKRMLWDRICKRGEGDKGPDNALDIDWETFEGYWNGFEDPVEEGEVVVNIV